MEIDNAKQRRLTRYKTTGALALITAIVEDA